MLGQKKEGDSIEETMANLEIARLPDSDQRLLEKSWIIYLHESQIDPEDTLYLITWSPSPEEMPDCDFVTQHQYHINTIADYLRGCKIGLFCVESTQQGYPHYHGWYQTSDDPMLEQLRIVCMKVMKRFGNVKVTKSVGKYRINSYSQQGNCLYYYKYDVLQQMFYIEDNPITKDSRCTINWCDEGYLWFFAKTGSKTSIGDLEAKVSNTKFYREFYADSRDLKI